jgi:hypothetical protein
MQITVHLNHQPGAMTIKVGNEPVNHLLPAEMERRKLVPAQLLPKPLLRGSHVGTHRTRPLVLGFLHTLTTHNPAR